MNVIADLIIVIIVLISAIWGMRKGFILSFFNFFGSMISFVVASFLSKPFGAFVSDKVIKPIFSEYLTNAFSDYLSDQSKAITENEGFSSAVSFFTRFGFDQNDVENLFQTNSQESEQYIQSAVDTLVTPVARSIGFALALLILFIIVFILLKILVKVLNLISKLPVLNLSNKVFGLIFGIGFGLLLGFVFSCGLVAFEPIMQSSDSPFFSGFSIEKTVLVNLFIDLLNI